MFPVVERLPLAVVRQLLDLRRHLVRVERRLQIVATRHREVI